MPEWPYSKEELSRYFQDAEARQGRGNNGPVPPRPEKKRSLFDFIYRRFENPRKGQAAVALFAITAFMLVFALAVGTYVLSFADEMPSLQQIENPNFKLATIAYTADHKELARYARQNRSWVRFDQISPHVINALVAGEDHRFYNHWGIDHIRTLAIPYHILLGDPQGGSTITQQLARNLYNEQIGRRVTVERKLKEMVTAVQLEQRYTKPEIIEMYLNTVEFGNNAFGIEAAARTFFGKKATELNELESATLVGMQKAITYYNPVRNPENAQRRRNVVLKRMVDLGYLPRAFYDAHKENPVEALYHSSEITASLAPYFAEYVRNWMGEWAEKNNFNLYTDGLIVYTTLDSRLQELAQQAVDHQMEGLQAVVDYEWSRAGNYYLGGETALYLKKTDYQPFAHFWESEHDLVDSFMRETARYRSLKKQNMSTAQALASLRENTAFTDSLRTAKTRLEAGFVSIDPRTGYVKTWVGGRNLAKDWYDHVAKAKRQPGSTFKPFVYTAAIYNGWSPYYMLRDSTFTYVDTAGNVWQPQNSGEMTGRMVTLREGLAHSKNTITGQLILEVGPSEVVFFAKRMGIESPLDEVPSLALGVSDVTLLEMTSAYSTLANGGLRYKPTAVTRIEDRNGNVLYEATPAPTEALSEATAYTVVDMMRGVIQEGTGIRINNQFKLGDYDLAGKTGTTQNSADGWFIMMHPDLVTGAWVGFNDRRITFRTEWWGQGAHNALFIVGDFFKAATEAPDNLISKERFPAPDMYTLPNPAFPMGGPNLNTGPDAGKRKSRDRVSW